jgi:hypothetical protein
VRVPALHHAITLRQVVLAVVELEDDLTVEHGHEIQRVGGVHARPLWILAREPDPTLVVGRVRRRRWEGDDPQRQPAGRRLEVERALRLPAVGRRARRPVEPEQVTDAQTVARRRGVGRQTVGQEDGAAVFETGDDTTN